MYIRHRFVVVILIYTNLRLKILVRVGEFFAFCNLNQTLKNRGFGTKIPFQFFLRVVNSQNKLLVLNFSISYFVVKKLVINVGIKAF